MPKVTVPVSNLIGGVSQQAEDVRFEGQFEEQINAYPSPIDGLSKRHPSEHVAKAVDGLVPSEVVHAINRSIDEQYLVVLQDKNLRVFDLEGNLLPVFGPGATTVDFSYLDSLNGDNLITGPQVFPGETFSPSEGWLIEVLDMEDPVATSGTTPFSFGVATRLANKQDPGSTSPGTMSFELGEPWLTSGNSQHVSCYFKRGNVGQVRLGWSSVDLGLDWTETFTLDGDGTATAFTDGLEAHIEQVTDDGWYYCRVSMDAGAVTGTSPTPTDSREVVIQIAHDGAGAGNGGQYVHAFGAVALDGGDADVPYTDAAALKARTVNDYTFILNTTKVTRVDDNVTTGSQSQWLAHLNIQAGNYDVDYGLDLDTDLNAASATLVRTWKGSGSVGSDEVGSAKTDDIAEAIKAGPTVGGNNYLDTLAYIDSEVEQHIVRLKTNDGSVLSKFQVNDSEGNQSSAALWGTLSELEDLPTVCTNGFRIKVSTDLQDELDDYWLEFHTDTDTADNFTKGHWEESSEPGIDAGIDQLTMPHQLVRMVDDQLGTVTGTAFGIYFEFGPIDWTPRAIGDDNTNPYPSFIGRTIRDVFFHRGRLGFLSDENVILSEVDRYFNFFRTTVRALIDSDVIDVTATGTTVDLLNSAVPFERQLLLFSDQNQFVLTGDPTLTPSTASIQRVTAFDTYGSVEPLAVGRTILFSYQEGNYTGVREMFTIGEDAEAFDSHRLTTHVPHYLEGRVVSMAASTLVDTACFVTDSAPNTVYVYKWTDSGRERVQLAWCKYEFEGDVRSVDFIGDTLWMTIQYTEGLFIEKMIVEPNPKDPHADYKILLDRRITDADCGISYSSITGLTEFTLPYEVENTSTFKVCSRSTASNTQRPGADWRIHSWDQATPGAHRLYLDGDFTQEPLWLGVLYEMRVDFSTLTWKTADRNGNQRPVLAGTYRLSYGNLLVHNTGYFEVDVLKYGSKVDETIFTGDLVDSPDVAIGQPTFPSSATHRFPILSRGDGLSLRLISSHHLPCNFLSAEWEANPISRSSRRSR